MKSAPGPVEAGIDVPLPHQTRRLAGEITEAASTRKTARRNSCGAGSMATRGQ